MRIKFINSLKNFLNQRIFLSKYERLYIKHNLLKWSKFKTKKYKKRVILVDLFPWYPFINFWAYIVNFLSNKKKAEIKFFYFNLYQSRASKIQLYIYKLKKIYNSFNATEGISEYNFKYSKVDFLRYKKKFQRLNTKSKIIKYKKDGIVIGDLIYDTYLRITYKPTANITDPEFYQIFCRAEKIFEEVVKYFKKNDVQYVLPSHVCYISYGIISRIANNLNIPVILIKTENRANSLFRLMKVNRSYTISDQPYFQYKNIFNRFSSEKKKISIMIGRKILQKRISGNYDSNLPYMPLSPFNKRFKLNKINLSKKRKIIIFPHCYFDNPHRFRSMIFNDFYEQVKYFLDLSIKLNEYDWYYKPHPNELQSELNVHKLILEKYPNVHYINKSVSHYDIIKLRPECIITNHGTIAHEYAAFKIPVINTGDNPHINYKFCFHAKNIKQLNYIMSNLNELKKRINFDKKEIYEYLYMHYEYFPKKFNENIYLKDRYFSSRNIKVNSHEKLLEQFIKYKNNYDVNIFKYLNNFFK